MPARAEFEKHAPEWDALNRARGNHVLLDSRFVAALIRSFAKPSTLFAVSTSPSARGMVLVEPGAFRLASTFQPSQSPLGLILLESGDLAVPMSRKLIRHLPGLSIGLSILQQDPDYSSFCLSARDHGIEKVDYIDTARLRLEGSFEDYWRSRSKNLTHNLGRQRRRLADKGQSVRLRVIRNPDQAAECVAEYGRLEGSGWKAARGTAVDSENTQGLFYRDLLRAFLATGEGVIYQLELDDRVIASDLCLERDGMLVILKTAYDASIEGLSPGLLLHQDIFEQCYAEGRIRVIEFYGRVREWHTKWTEDFRRMYHLNLYRGPWIRRIHEIARKGIALLKRSPTEGR
jgi:Acetyltransferase (GNAT) domain